MADKVSTIFAPPTSKYYPPADNFSKSEKSKARKTLALILIIIGAGISSYLGYKLVTGKGSRGTPYLFADVYYGKANVSVDGTAVGETPLNNFLVKKGTHKVSLESTGTSYETNMTFSSGSPSMVKRDLGVDQVFSGGLDLWYEKNGSGNSLSLISEPSDATVFIDGSESGKTPYTNDKLTEGAYEVRLEKEGCEAISERVNVVKGQKLNISMKLFPLPAPASVKLMDGSENLYDIVSGNSFVVSNPANWAQALIYWNKTRGINIMGFGVNRDLVFSNILDYNGVFYDNTGKVIALDKIVLGNGKIAYLRRESDGPGVSSSAKDNLAKLGTSVTTSSTSSAKVKETPTGWLRVRSTPSLGGEELGRVNTGDTVTVLEQKTGWLKIKTAAGVEGWASGDYLQLL